MPAWCSGVTPGLLLGLLMRVRWRMGPLAEGDAHLAGRRWEAAEEEAKSRELERPAGRFES